MSNVLKIQNFFTVNHFSLLCLFLLIREWLIPIDEMTGFHMLSKFSVGLLCLYVIEILIPKRIYATLLSLAGFVVSLNFLYFQTPLLQLDWLRKLVDLLQVDFFQVYYEQGYQTQPVTYYLLVNLGIIFMVPVLRFLIVTRGLGIGFVLITGGFFACLDSYGWYGANDSFVRIICISFALLASLEMDRLEQMSKWIDQSWRKWLPLLVSSGIIGAIVIPAYFAPKYGPSWTDPYTYFVTRTSSGEVDAKPLPKQVGYSNRDDSLGGPMLDDEELVFVGVTNEKYYWRGNTREVYTGTGWLKREQKLMPVLEPNKYKWPQLLFERGEGKEVRATLQFHDKYRYPQIFYQGELKQLTNYTPETLTILYEPDGGHIQAHDGVYDVFRGDQVFKEPDYMYLRMSGYSYVSQIPFLNEAKLNAAGVMYSDEIRNNYLQLPKTVPLRVKQLAHEITMNSPNPYSKVKAVVQHLHDNSKYKYEREDVPAIQPGHDFVDQFLFEDLRGYCDHFSTSMVVMLRSVGIPARWVKGFTAGKESGRDQKGNYILEVRNKDTHSWVEVYFPEIGWLPFEPTPTFSSPLQVESLAAASRVLLPELADTPQARKPVEEKADREDGMDEDAGIPWGWMTVAGTLLVWLVYWSWSRITRIQRLMLRSEWVLFHRHMSYQQQFLLLLGILEKDYVPRNEDETVREYINRLDLSYDEKDEFRQVTGLFEKIVYGKQQIENEIRRNATEGLASLQRKLRR